MSTALGAFSPASINFLAGNPRLRVMIAAVLAILALNGLLAWRDALKLESRKVTVAQQRLQQLRVDSRSKVWLARAKQAAQQRAVLEGAPFQAHSQVALEAGLREWINPLLTDAGITQPTVAIGAPSTATDDAASNIPDGLRLRVIKLGFGFEPEKFAQFTEALARSGRMVAVQSLVITTFPSAHVDIQLSVYAKLDAKPNGKGAGA